MSAQDPALRETNWLSVASYVSSVRKDTYPFIDPTKADLTGKSVLITGASKGIGLAVTRTLLSEGTRIVAASRKSTPELDALSGAADIIAAAIGADRDSVLDKAAPEMMKPVTGRLIAPQEVADVIALLASPRSAGTTGADFAVDGGLLKQI